MLEFLRIIGMLALATLLHELGHFILLKYYRIPVQKIQVFYLELIEINFNSIKFALGVLPIGGFTLISEDKFRQLGKKEKVSIAAGGIFVNLICVLTGWYFGNYNLWFYINLYKLFINTIPMPGNDCFQILDIIFDGKFYRRKK